MKAWLAAGHVIDRTVADIILCDILNACTTVAKSGPDRYYALIADATDGNMGLVLDKLTQYRGDILKQMKDYKWQDETKHLQTGDIKSLKDDITGAMEINDAADEELPIKEQTKAANTDLKDC